MHIQKWWSQHLCQSGTKSEKTSTMSLAGENRIYIKSSKVRFLLFSFVSNSILISVMLQKFSSSWLWETEEKRRMRGLWTTRVNHTCIRNILYDYIDVNQNLTTLFVHNVNCFMYMTRCRATFIPSWICSTRKLGFVITDEDQSSTSYQQQPSRFMKTKFLPKVKGYLTTCKQPIKTHLQRCRFFVRAKTFFGLNDRCKRIW